MQKNVMAKAGETRGSRTALYSFEINKSACHITKPKTLATSLNIIDDFQRHNHN